MYIHNLHIFMMCRRPEGVTTTPVLDLRLPMLEDLLKTQHVQRGTWMKLVVRAKYRKEYVYVDVTLQQNIPKYH